VGNLPTAQRCNPYRLNADAVIAYISFVPSIKWHLIDSTAKKLRVSLKSLFDGFDVHDGSIKNSCHMAGRDGQLNQTLFKISTTRSCPDNGGCDLVTFFDCLHITLYGVGAPVRVFFPLKTHKTWMNVEPFAWNRPKRSTALQAGSTIARQR
jgi:hypothetical protein